MHVSYTLQALSKLKESIKEKKALKRKREETKEDAGFGFEYLFCQIHI
jgi:hypothetical protein